MQLTNSKTNLPGWYMAYRAYNVNKIQLKSGKPNVLSKANVQRWINQLANLVVIWVESAPKERMN
jgi:hypothetical protein